MNITFTMTTVFFVCLGVVIGCGGAFAGMPASVDSVSMRKSSVSDAVARYGNFIMRLDDYDEHFLYDIRPLGGDRLGVIMLSPKGYEEDFVFQFSGTGKPTNLYEHVDLPPKKLLRTIEGKSMLISEARQLARKNETTAVQ
jgi:hypothetical protein